MSNSWHFLHNTKLKKKKKNCLIARDFCTLYVTETYSEPCQTSKMECFEKIVNDFQLLIIFEKCLILDVGHGSKPVSALQLHLLRFLHFHIESTI